MNDVNDLLQYCALFVIAIVILLVNRRITLLTKVQLELALEVKEHKEVRKKLYQELADPDKIEAEMEAGARRREMYDAQRSTLPRQPPGEPAKVWRPKMRGAKPGNFRLQRP